MNFSESFIRILLIMGVLIAFIAPGYILRKKKMIGEGALGALSNILLYACQPLMMIKALAVNDVRPTLTATTNIFIVFLLSAVSMIVVYFISRIVFKGVKDVKKRDVYSFTSVFSNCGFIGIPFVDIMTDGNGEALMFLAVYNLSFNILVWTLGVYLMTQNVKDVNLKRAFLNPAMIGSYVGLLLFFIPQINIFTLENTSQLAQIPVYMASTTSVLSMIIVGIRMADIPLKEIVTDIGSYISAGVRLIISPLVTIAILILIDLFVAPFEYGYVWLAVVIGSAMSPAASVVAYAEKFDGDGKTATVSFILGTFLSIITIPVLMAVLSIWYI